MANNRTLTVVIAGDSKGAQSAAEDTSVHMSKMSAFIGGAFAKAGAMVTDMLSDIGSKVVGFATDSISAYRDLGTGAMKIQRLTGGSMEDASKLSFLAQQTGVDAEKMGKALTIFDKNLVAGKVDGFNSSLKGQAERSDEVKEATEKLAKAQEHLGDVQAIQHTKSQLTVSDQITLRKANEDVSAAQEKLNEANAQAGPSMETLGIKVRDASGQLLPMRDILGNVADKFVDMDDGAEKVALAQQLFGKSGADMIPLLNKGGDAINDIMDDAQKYGLVLNETDKAQIKAANTADRQISASMMGLKVMVGRDLLPELNKFTGWLADELPKAIQSANQWLDDHKQEIHDVMDRLSTFGSWLTNTLIPNMVSLLPQIWKGLNQIADAGQVVMGVIVGAAGYIWDGMNKVADFAQIVMGVVVGFAEFVWNALNKVADGAQIMMGVIVGAAGFIWDGLNKIADGAQIMMGIVVGAFHAIVDAGGWVNDRINDMVHWFSELPGRIASVVSGAASGIFDGISGAFKSVINWIIDKWNGLSFTIPSFGPFGGATISTPHVNRLHTGGVFIPPDGQSEGLALLRAGEVFVPTDAGATSSGPAVVVQGSVYGIRDLVGALADFQRNGGCVPWSMT